MRNRGGRSANIRPAVVWLLVLIVLCVSTTVLAMRESAHLVSGLREEMLLAIEESGSAVADGDMVKAERAAMRFWRLARLESATYLAGAEGRQLSQLATVVSEAAAGWRAVPLSAFEQSQIALQLLNLKQMLLTGDYSQAGSLAVWLAR